MITVKNLNLTINQQKILNNVSCSIQKGKITTFIGKSGAGKTTLLKTFAGLYPVQKNTVFLQNIDITELTNLQRANQIGFVFQNFNLFAHMTVLENCMDPLLIQQVSNLNVKTAAQEKLNLLGMVDFINKYPNQLSGGQQQRVAIARALCLNPELILLDEPTASLDPINTNGLITILKNLIKNGITVLISSQDMNFVSKIFDQVYFMQDGAIIEYTDTIANLEQTVSTKNFLEE